jgi:hypothetical protein
MDNKNSNLREVTSVAATDHSIETILSVAARTAPHKAILSESGWAYLINDSGDFLPLLYGANSWSEQDQTQSSATIRARYETLSKRNILYRKFIIPEKPVVYPEYLPRELRVLKKVQERPAQLMARDNPGLVFYLEHYLASQKSLGLLYFRGDTHANWLGAWLIYRYVMRQLIADGVRTPTRIFRLRDLLGSIASYEGDLISHLSPTDIESLDKRFGHTFPEHGIELVVKLDIPEKDQAASRVDTPQDYQIWYDTRETFVFERPDKRGIKALFFRDSTFDRGAMELLAQHFSRSLFIWHQGVVDLDAIDREQPDLIVHAMAERFIIRYPNFSIFTNGSKS